MIVDASLHLYNGDLGAPSAPWPTRRVPRTAVQDSGMPGWMALRTAEETVDQREEQRVT